MMRGKAGQTSSAAVWVTNKVADSDDVVIEKRCFSIVYTRVPVIATPLSLLFCFDRS